MTGALFFEDEDRDAAPMSAEAAVRYRRVSYRCERCGRFAGSSGIEVCDGANVAFVCPRCRRANENRGLTS